MGGLFGGNKKKDAAKQAAAAQKAAEEQAAKEAAAEKERQEKEQAKRDRDQAYGARGQRLSSSLGKESAYAKDNTYMEDKDLAPEKSSNRKRDDMKMRCLLIKDANPNCVVSIHQNSFSDASAKGAQVFYYDGSEEGKQLGEILQNALVNNLDPSNHRLAKGNASYYLLKKA